MSIGNGRDYKLLVPFDVTHNVSVSTRYYKINDEIGAALNAAGQAIPVRVASGAPPKVVNLPLTCRLNPKPSPPPAWPG